MTSKLTRLTDDELTETLRLATSGYPLPAWVEGNLRQAFAELQERRKADSEPVAWIHSNNDIGIPAITVSQKIGHYWMAEFENVQPLYRHAQPAPETEREPIAWLNDAYLARGVVDGEAGSEDAGPGYIPVYREASPAQTAPVVLTFEEWCKRTGQKPQGWVRDAMKEAYEGGARSAPERDKVRREHAEWSQATFGNVGPIGPLKHLSKEALEAAAEPGDLSEWADMQFLLWDAQRRAGITDEQITQAMIEKLAVNRQREWPAPKDGEPRLHIKEQPAPVVPDGWVMVPKEPTERMVIDGFESEPDETFSEPEVWEAYQKMSGCDQAAYRVRLCWAAMLTAAPQEVK